MNLIKKTTLALGLLAAAGVSYAQNATAPVTSNGLLGQSFAEFNYSLADVDSVSDHGHSLTVSGNVPVLPSLLDLGGAYTYSWFNGAGKSHANTVNAYANAYVALEGAKPFLGAAVGYTWASLPFGLSDNDPFWSISAGVEIPVGALVLTPRITYSDDFEGRIGNSDDSWTYEVEGHYWFSPKTGVYGAVGLVDNHRSPIDVWNYRVGLRFRY